MNHTHNCNIYFRPGRKDEISFADSNSQRQSRHFVEESSSFIASEAQVYALSKQKKRIQSPVHNMHYKYLPPSYGGSDMEKRDVRKEEKLKKMPDVRNNRGDMNEIQKKIRHILNSIDVEQNRQAKMNQKYTEDCGRNSKSMFAVKQRQKQIYQTPEKMVYKQNYEHSSSFKGRSNHTNLSSIGQQNRMRTPLGELNQNRTNYDLSHHKLNNHQAKKVDSSAKKSIYSNLSSISLKRESSREVIVRGKNIDNEIDKFQQKIRSINKIKNRLNINFEVTPEKKKSPLKEIVRKIQPLRQTQLTNLPLNKIESKSSLFDEKFYLQLHKYSSELTDLMFKRQQSKYDNI